ncbi:ATP-dependent RNA helicase DDX60 [Nematocida sp. AWRm78]|nr:ATP-dependent RNA helicase DDX60 [Nematocida sp. AWRm79]KAI5182466.1 ATP-dependent RNA helicase DDX60 [Nematocida sp. AWRm78]
MTKEMEEIYKEWYKTMPSQMIDVSESFVGIGKIIINGHSLYKYIEDVYSIQSDTLPLNLLSSIADTIGQSLIASGFKDSYLVLFEEDNNTEERKICTREVAATLEKGGALKIIWFHSMYDHEFKNFIKEEHICLGVGYQDSESLVFLNTVLGFSLYAAVLDKETFRPPRLFMFVISPAMYLCAEKYVSREYTPKKVELLSIESTVSEVEGIVKKHLGDAKYAEHIGVVRSPNSLSKYSKERKPVDRELIIEIEEVIRKCNVCSIKSVIDGRLLQPVQEKTSDVSAAEIINEALEKVGEERPFVPTTMSSVRFYNEEQERSFRTEQMYIESLKKNAQSLHEGKHLHNPIMLVSEKTKKKKEVKEKIGKKQLEIIEKNKKQKELEAKKKDVAFLRSFLAKYESFSATYEKRRHLESFLVRAHSSFICRKVFLLRIEFYSELWSLEKRKKRPSEKDLVSLYMDCTTFIEKYSKDASIEELQYVLQAMLDQGFGATILEMCERYQISYTNKRDSACTVIYNGGEPVSLVFDPATTKDPNDYDISFLMRAAGDKLKRTLGSKPDPRLLFEPDEWQRDLLKIVDDSESAVICAPTSSGKTFICYYAMEKVLRESNDDIVIFVAPTKALVNQVAADVYARFGSKPYIKQNNILQGICMSDFQISPFNCQILITVPNVLEKILSMPPEQAKKAHPYLDRVKYIVIDEVHKISDNNMGPSMEKIIHFSPCSLLLLSATLGNLDEFYGWVEKIESRKNRRCHLIQHKERYCEIKNYVFVPKKINSLETCHKTTRAPGEQSIAPIHSLFAYSFRVIKEDGFSDDVNFLPEELLNLYYAIFAVLRKDQRSLIKEYRPKRFFKTNCITKGDVKKYENYVIGTFRDMIKTNTLDTEQVIKIYEILIREAKEGFQKIESDLKEQLSGYIEKEPAVGTRLLQNKPLKTISSTPKEEQISSEDENLAKKMENMELSPAEISPDILLYNIDYLLDNILDLTVELEAANKLPCIVFNLERTVCNALAIRLSEELENFEKCAPPVLTKADIRENEKVLKEMRRARDANVATGKDAWINESIVAEEIAGRNIDLNAKDPRFCFTDPTIASSGAYLLDEYAKSLRKTGRLDPRLIQALYRGIGVHHSGIPKKYRNMVEILFRMKQLRVVFATDTLALGINMPCRTAVFAGDSLHLDSMSFKQMAGRAGRRGYDTQGNVVFFGIPKQKVRSLITSYLPRIKGSYPYTSLLAVQSARPTVKSSTVESILSYPLMSLSLPKEAFRAINGLSTKDFTQKILDAQKRYLISKQFLSSETMQNDLILHSTEGKKEVPFTKKLSHTSGLCDMALNTLSYGAEAFVLMSLVNEGVLDQICKQEKDKEEIYKSIIHLVAYIFEIHPLPSISSLPALPDLEPSIFARLEAYYKESIAISREYMHEEDAAWTRLIPDSVHYTPIAQSFFILPYLYTKKNSYILKYFIDQNVKQIIKENGVGETELWRRLKNIEDVLIQLVAYYTEYFPTSIAMPFVSGTLSQFRERFAKMHA